MTCDSKTKVAQEVEFRKDHKQEVGSPKIIIFKLPTSNFGLRTAI